MPEQKEPKPDKKISLHPLDFEEALKGLLETEPPPKEQKPEQKTHTKPRQHRKKTTEK